MSCRSRTHTNPLAIPVEVNSAVKVLPSTLHRRLIK